MKQGLLITCPEYDDGTAYLTYFSKNILEVAAKKFLKTKIVKDKELNMERFSEIIKKLDYRLTVLNGHGSPSSPALFGVVFPLLSCSLP